MTHAERLLIDDAAVDLAGAVTSLQDSDMILASIFLGKILNKLQTALALSAKETNPSTPL